MADYWSHWLTIGKATDADKLPKIFFVNWFRRDADGRFLWPGFGENSRVLKWVFERVDGDADAVETPIGLLPTPDALDTDGLEIADDDLAELLSVDAPGWRDAVPQIREHYATVRWRRSQRRSQWPWTPWSPPQLTHRSVVRNGPDRPIANDRTGCARLRAVKTRTAVITAPPGKWEVVEVDLEEPRQGELLLKMVASGLCHSDDHVATGDIPVGIYPFAGGHEGAGIVEQVGPNTPGCEVGDHVVLSFLPGCGRCRWCASGMQNLCDLGANLLNGCRADGSYRMSLDGQPVGQMCGISTFSEHTVVSTWRRR